MERFSHQLRQCSDLPVSANAADRLCSDIEEAAKGQKQRQFMDAGWTLRKECTGLNPIANLWLDVKLPPQAFTCSVKQLKQFLKRKRVHCSIQGRNPARAPVLVASPHEWIEEDITSTGHLGTKPPRMGPYAEMSLTVKWDESRKRCSSR